MRPVDTEVLYRTHLRPLYTFIYSKVGNREAVEDLTSEVFAKALTHLDRMREEHSIVAWLYRVAHNAIIDYWRAGHGARVIALEEAHMAHRSPPAPEVVRQEQTAARADANIHQRMTTEVTKAGHLCDNTFI
jgi:RNA polymerase sigma-70 factor (ECF subfamily)